MAEDRVERRLTTILAADVVSCSRLMVNAGVILVTSSPAFAYHDTVGGGAAVGGIASIGAFLPFVVGVVVVMAWPSRSQPGPYDRSGARSKGSRNAPR